MDKFLLDYDATELRTASEFLSNWLPYLSGGLCSSCIQILSDRIRSLDPENDIQLSTPGSIDRINCKDDGGNCSKGSNGKYNSSADDIDNIDTVSLGSWKDHAYFSGEHTSEVSSPSETPSFLAVPDVNSGVKKSWADMAQEDELAEEEDDNEVSPKAFCMNESTRQDASHDEAKRKVVLSRDQRERYRFSNVKREKDFICLERVKGKHVNILDGLELHSGVFSSAEQTRIVKFVEELQEMGRKKQLKERTYSAPNKWMKGKGRITLQFGCCYNYAFKDGVPPGIVKNELVDPLPSLFKVMIKRLVRWHVLPPSCVPDSCIVNIYEEGDCIPPHIDHHDFVRPFCTVSFLSECEIKFGTNLKIVGPGEFEGAYAIPLPVGSVFVLKGNGADVAKHCVPAVPTKRISITFRKMDETKIPIGYVQEPDLQGLQPLPIPGVDISVGPKHSSSGKQSTTPREDRMDRGRGFKSRRFDDDGILPLPEIETPMKYNNSNNPSGSRGRGSNLRYPDNGYSENGRFSGRGRQGGGFNRQRVQ